MIKLISIIDNTAYKSITADIVKSPSLIYIMWMCVRITRSGASQAERGVEGFTWVVHLYSQLTGTLVVWESLKLPAIINVHVGMHEAIVRTTWHKGHRLHHLCSRDVIDHLVCEFLFFTSHTLRHLPVRKRRASDMLRRGKDCYRQVDSV